MNSTAGSRRPFLQSIYYVFAVSRGLTNALIRIGERASTLRCLCESGKHLMKIRGCRVETHGRRGLNRNHPRKDVTNTPAFSRDIITHGRTSSDLLTEVSALFTWVHCVVNYCYCFTAAGAKREINTE